MEKFEDVYCGILSGKLKTSGEYGSDFLYSDAIKFGTTIVPIYKSIIQEIENKDKTCQWYQEIINDYLSWINAIICYENFIKNGIIPKT